MFKATSILGLMLLVGSMSYIVGDTLPKTVNVGLEKAFIPVGFDDNDKVQIAVEGEFPNTCYRVGPAALKVDGAKKTITVQQQAYLYSGVCMQMIVPFTQVVDVGFIQAGNYQLIDSKTKQVLGTLPVVRGTNEGPDDYLYAPITDAYIVNQERGKKNVLVLSGSFSDRCSEFEDVKVIYQNQVLVVQPIIKRISTDRCEAIKTRFLKMVELKEGAHGLHLLHVRSLEGQAINKMVELQ